ncbi:hypothetical protein WL40_13920 [Burkholderia ubonensis]|nr:hypothetical protein WL40_13920 [Burkholderia ubonensis]
MQGNRGRPIRTLTYNRTSADDALDERIERTVVGPLGFMMSRVDARLFSSGGTPNFVYTPSLSGRVLRTAGVDAGTTVSLADVDGRPAWSRDARDTVSGWTYDALGRPTSVTETADGQTVIRDVFRYGEAEPKAQAYNLRGQCTRHYDTAGRLVSAGFALTGQPLNQTRQLLADPDAEADWTGDDEAAWAGALDAASYPTAWSYDATGIWLTQTDAMGNTQHQVFDVAGRLGDSRLTLAGAGRQPVLASIDYSAAGQVLSETAGNGVLSTYAYEPETQRLVRLTVTRPARPGRPPVLQDLHYAYDPVGNVLSVRDDAQPTTYWRNQQVEPQQSFTYDALYQLISATGRESAGGSPDPSRPVPIPLPTDASIYTNYTRTYSYDRGGNLTRIHHAAPASQHSYTTELTVSDRSNRALLARDGLTPAQVDAQFDATGHQLALTPDQTLDWTRRGQLRQVTPITRDGQADDRERYRYGSDGMRVLKVSTQQHATTTQRRQVRYLPGIECRTTHTGTTETESLQVITVAGAGRASVRALRWTNGKPTGVDSDALRYSYRDQIGSSLLELDQHAELCSREAYYPYGGTAIWTARSQAEADTKTRRYSGKERDATGLYDYGFRYYQPWLGRWLSADPAGTVDGLNLYRMVRNNPTTLADIDGYMPKASNKKDATLDRKPTRIKDGSTNVETDGDLGGRAAAGEDLFPRELEIAKNQLKKITIQKGTELFKSSRFSVFDADLAKSGDIEKLSASGGDKNWVGQYFAFDKEISEGYFEDYLDETGSGAVYLHKIVVSNDIIAIENINRVHASTNFSGEDKASSIKSYLKENPISLEHGEISFGDVSEPLIHGLSKLGVAFKSPHDEDEGTFELILGHQLLGNIEFVGVEKVVYKNYMRK